MIREIMRLSPLIASVFVFVFGILHLLAAASQGAVLHSLSDISRSLCTEPITEADFSTTATVSAVRSVPHLDKGTNSIQALALEDASGAIVIVNETTNALGITVGDIIHVVGRIHANHMGRAPAAVANRITTAGHIPCAKPVAATFHAIQDGSLDYRRVHVTGTVRDAERSDSSRNWVILKLVMGDCLLDVSIFCPGKSIQSIQSLIGAEVRITGISSPGDFSLRTQMGRIFSCWSEEDIEVLARPSLQPSSIPDISKISGQHPSIILRQGRHKAIGRVLATWHGDRMLIRTASGNVCRVELTDATLPAAGDSVEAIGFPESDLYHLNLVRATWTRYSARIAVEDPAVASLSDIKIRGLHPEIVDIRCHGQVIQLTGVICSLPSIDNGDGVLYVQTDHLTIPIDISSNPGIANGLSAGCMISVTGVCVIDTPNWTPNALCQKIDTFSIVVRNPEDIILLKRPPWWTMRILLIAGTILLSVIVIILIWNRSLIILAERRGRELLREQIGRIRATLKVDERTRLAADLHDSLSQNLTGISLQLDLINRLTGDADPSIAKHLDIATRTLQSCRNELRGCIWDLRSQALDALSMEDAIHMTLRPHLDTAKLSLRFPVSRRKLDDNTTHAVLRIIRELVSNALRHGLAKSVRIAGVMENDRLAVSVQDDGTGFDPSSRLNSGNGHFGLDGIRERLRHFDGNMTIDGSPGRGTKVIFSIRLSGNETDEGETHV